MHKSWVQFIMRINPLAMEEGDSETEEENQKSLSVREMGREYGEVEIDQGSNEVEAMNVNGSQGTNPHDPIESLS